MLLKASLFLDFASLPGKVAHRTQASNFPNGILMFTLCFIPSPWFIFDFLGSENGPVGTFEDQGAHFG